MGQKFTCHIVVGSALVSLRSLYSSDWLGLGWDCSRLKAPLSLESDSQAWGLPEGPSSLPCRLSYSFANTFET